MTNCGTNYFLTGRNSFFQFTGANGVYFTLDGANLGTAITIVHAQDWVGVAPGICAKRATQSVTAAYTCGEVPPCSTGATPAMGTSGECCGSIIDNPSLDISNCSFYATWGRSNRTLQVERTPGVCGSSSGGSFISAPAANLCSTGSASAVYDYGYWSWTCTGVANAQVACSATKSSPAPTVTFYADNSGVISYNAGTNLHWSSTNATSCTDSGNWSGTQPTSGSAATGSLTFSPTYYLSCSGPGGSSGTYTITLKVSPSVQIHF